MVTARISEFSKDAPPPAGVPLERPDEGDGPAGNNPILSAVAFGRDKLVRDARSCAVSSFWNRVGQALFSLMACCIVGMTDDSMDYGAFESVVVIGALALVYAVVDIVLLGWFLRRGTDAPALIRSRAGCSTVASVVLIADVAFLGMTYASFGASAGVRGYISDSCDMSSSMEESCSKLAAGTAMMFFAALTFVFAAAFSVQIRKFEAVGEAATEKGKSSATPGRQSQGSQLAEAC